MEQPSGGMFMDKEVTIDIDYQIDVFQIFKEEHQHYKSLTQGKDRIEKRYSQFIKLFADQLRFEIVKQRKNKVRNICRSYLELLWQLNIAGFEFINNEQKKYIK